MGKNKDDFNTDVNLSKEFENFDKLHKNLNSLMLLKVELEKSAKTNPELKKYIDTINKIEDTQNKISDLSKGALYDKFVEEDIDLLEGQYVSVSLKRPYYKLDFDKTAFIKEYPQGTKMYETYFKQKLTKGNVIVKKLF